MANIFKSLTPKDYSITPFPAYYRYSYTYESGSTSNLSDVFISYGEKFLTSSGIVRTPNASYELFDSIIQTFYSPIPYALYGTRPDSYTPTQSVYVVNITQDIFGEKVLPGSFSIRINNTQSFDDGIGNIFVSSSGTGSIVGRVFYDKGVALLKPTSSVTTFISKDGVYIGNGTSVEINFSSSITLYENKFTVRLDPIDFLYSMNNPTVQVPMSGTAQTPMELMASQSTLLPYVTTIGFYNDKNELLLVAKPSVPIQRTKDVTQTFIVKFDT